MGYWRMLSSGWWYGVGGGGWSRGCFVVDDGVV